MGAVGEDHLGVRVSFGVVGHIQTVGDVEHRLAAGVFPPEGRALRLEQLHFPGKVGELDPLDGDLRVVGRAAQAVNDAVLHAAVGEECFVGHLAPVHGAVAHEAQPAVDPADPSLGRAKGVDEVVVIARAGGIDRPLERIGAARCEGEPFRTHAGGVVIGVEQALHHEHVVDGDDPDPGVPVRHEDAGAEDLRAAGRGSPQAPLESAQPAAGDLVLGQGHLVVNQKPQVLVRGIGVGVPEVDMGGADVDPAIDPVVPAPGAHHVSRVVDRFHVGFPLRFAAAGVAEHVEIALRPGDTGLEGIVGLLDAEGEAAGRVDGDRERRGTGRCGQGTHHLGGRGGQRRLPGRKGKRQLLLGDLSPVPQGDADDIVAPDKVAAGYPDLRLAALGQGVEDLSLEDLFRIRAARERCLQARALRQWLQSPVIRLDHHLAAIEVIIRRNLQPVKPGRIVPVPLRLVLEVGHYLLGGKGAVVEANGVHGALEARAIAAAGRPHVETVAGGVALLLGQL